MDICPKCYLPAHFLLDNPGDILLQRACLPTTSAHQCINYWAPDGVWSGAAEFHKGMQNIVHVAAPKLKLFIAIHRSQPRSAFLLFFAHRLYLLCGRTTPLHLILKGTSRMPTIWTLTFQLPGLVFLPQGKSLLWSVRWIPRIAHCKLSKVSIFTSYSHVRF